MSLKFIHWKNYSRASKSEQIELCNQHKCRILIQKNHISQLTNLMYFIIFLINGLIIEFCARTQHCGCAFNKIFRLVRVGGTSLLKLLYFFVLTVTRHLKIFVKPVGVQLLPGLKKKKDTFNWLSLYVTYLLPHPICCTRVQNLSR